MLKSWYNSCILTKQREKKMNINFDDYEIPFYDAFDDIEDLSFDTKTLFTSRVEEPFVWKVLKKTPAKTIEEAVYWEYDRERGDWYTYEEIKFPMSYYDIEPLAAA